MNRLKLVFLHATSHLSLESHSCEPETLEFVGIVRARVDLPTAFATKIFILPDAANAADPPHARFTAQSCAFAVDVCSSGFWNSNSTRRMYRTTSSREPSTA